MKSSERAFLNIVLAALPLLDKADSFSAALKISGVVVSIFWLTIFFFKVSRPLFPKKGLGISIVLWIAAWTEAALTYTAGEGLSPFCALSLLLLLSFYFIKELKLSAPDSWIASPGSAVPRGIGFAAILIYLGVSREIFRNAGTLFFDQPAGVLFLIAFAAWLWQNQPGKEIVK